MRADWIMYTSIDFGISPKVGMSSIIAIADLSLDIGWSVAGVSMIARRRARKLRTSSAAIIVLSIKPITSVIIDQKIACQRRRENASAGRSKNTSGLTP